jgi:NADH-quinone oxidoreductase subunit L
LIPLVLLAIPSAIVGWWFSSKLKDFFPNYTLTSISEHNFMNITNLMLILGISTAWACYIKWPNLPKLAQRKLQFVYAILIKKYGFDLLYQNILAPVVYLIGKFSWNFADTALIDGAVVNGTAKAIEKAARIVRKMQTGYIYHYAFFMMTGFFILFGWLVFR